MLFAKEPSRSGPCPGQVAVYEPDPSCLDSPYKGREFRLYVAITNRCNRTCPFCSTWSKIDGRTHMAPAMLESLLPTKGRFQVQLEGGEPFLHPRFLEFIELLARKPRCSKIIVATNGTLFPFVQEGNSLDANGSIDSIRCFLRMLPAGVLFKVSLNHALLDADPLMFDKAKLLALAVDAENGSQDGHDAMKNSRPELDRTRTNRGDDMGKHHELIFNLRKRNDAATGRDDFLDMLAARHGLVARTNSFYLQRYGRNENDIHAKKPFLVGTNFALVNPDGKLFGTDLIGRSNAMRDLP